MNKELLDQLSTDEQQIAAEIGLAADAMQISPNFQWDLETRLMHAVTQKTRHDSRWQKIMPSLGWALVAGCVLFLLNWTIRSLALNPSEVGAEVSTPPVSFISEVQQGNICVGRLALEHGFNVFLSNREKTELVAVDVGTNMSEIRSFAWSANGKQLALIGNTTGTGSIYVTYPVGGQVGYLLSSSQLGYLMNAAWSRDGKQFVLWSLQNNKVLYLLNSDGTDAVEKQLSIQILGTPQFAPDNQSILFHGADTSSAGLFEVKLNGSEARLINPLMENASGFAFSPDGSQLAYMEYHHDLGEAQLWSEDLTTHNATMLGKFPIAKGSGSSVPATANMSWSADGKSIVFDVGLGANDRVIYLAHTDDMDLTKVVDAGYAPAISNDGRCLAYMNDKQLFLLDLIAASNSAATPSIFVADIPAGRGSPNYQLNKIQWQP